MDISLKQKYALVLEEIALFNVCLGQKGWEQTKDGTKTLFSGKKPIQGKVALDMLICHTWLFLPDKCGGGQGALRAGGSGGKCEILLLSWGTSWTRRNVFLQFKPEYIYPCSPFFTCSYLPYIQPKSSAELSTLYSVSFKRKMYFFIISFSAMILLLLLVLPFIPTHSLGIANPPKIVEQSHSL